MGLEYKLFVDLDGVLANFDEKVKEITGKYPNELKLKDMWRQISPPRYEDFYYKLDFMPDAHQLWNYVKKYEPTILTGLPLGNWAKGQKVRWVGEHLGWQTKVITCMASDKYKESGEGHILIDDRIKAEKPWVNAGGIFIHHTSASNSIIELKKLGL